MGDNIREVDEITGLTAHPNTVIDGDTPLSIDVQPQDPSPLVAEVFHIHQLKTHFLENGFKQSGDLFWDSFRLFHHFDKQKSGQKTRFLTAD